MKLLQVIFGVILPAIALVVELVSHICAAAFMNPIPTIWHAILIAYVVAANLFVLCSLKNDYTPRALEPLLVGGAMAISMVYAVRFLPILPMSAIAVMFVGLGVLSFAPLSALIVAIGLAMSLSKMKVDFRKNLRNSQKITIGFLVGFLVLMGIEMPATMTKVALKNAASSNPREARSGILMLQSFGNKLDLLRLCYGDSFEFGSHKRMTDFYDNILGLSVSASPEQARKIFYRTTGTPFNAYPKPTSGMNTWEDRFDTEVAGEVVGGRVPDLSLSASELQVDADPNAAVADVSWTMTFKNDGPYENSEARTKIALPPGAVVSDLTLWIDGKPQPAAFGAKSTVRAAYEGVVRAMRDPVLVTSIGTDRVLMQCFPVPPRGGTMKMKIQIAIPLVIESDTASLFLPRLVENNFDVKCGTKTSIASTTRIASAPSFMMANEPGDSKLSGLIGQRQLFETLAPLVFERSKSASANETPSELFAVNSKGIIIRQSIQERTLAPCENVVVVIDGSLKMGDYAGQIASALASIPERLPWSVVIAADTVSALTPQDKLYQELTPSKVAELLGRLHFAGGPDNAQALAWANVIAQKKPNSAIVWVHGPQPVLFQEPDASFPHEKGNQNVPIYSLEVEPSSNVITEKLSDRLDFRTVLRKGTVDQDLKRVFGDLSNGSRSLAAVRTKVDKSLVAARGGQIKPGNSIVRLWASEQVDQLIKQGKNESAAQLASSNRIVTPVSGAVVLESKEDYQQAGLDPPKSDDSIPATPEPEMWLLIAIVLLAVLVQSKQQIRSLIRCRS